jgi:hypothetical protein
VPPNTSLATVPVAYYGGNAARRGTANIEMLSRMRVCMLEKWEGHCWQDCLGNGTGSPQCSAGCAAENAILDTAQRIKAINPAVSVLLYFNTMLAFPFYSATGRFEAANALTLDMNTHKPISIRNDEGMEGIFIYGFEQPVGQQLFIEAVKNWTSTGVIDGIFADKWASGAQVTAAGQWQFCNHNICGNVTEPTARAWNEGKAKVLAALTTEIGEGPVYSNDGPHPFPPFTLAPSGGALVSDFSGNVIRPDALMDGDPRVLVRYVADNLKLHRYLYCTSTGDQKWYVDPNAPATLLSQCSDDCLARFLLAVLPGAFLGTNGWDDDYGRPLGDPLGPAVYTAAAGAHPATLHRNFSSGTYAIFTYGGGKKGGHGETWWEGRPPIPPPSPPSPPPSPPEPCTYVQSMDMDCPWEPDQRCPNQQHEPSDSAAGCCALCHARDACGVAVWHDGACYFKPPNATHRPRTSDYTSCHPA